MIVNEELKLVDIEEFNQEAQDVIAANPSYTIRIQLPIPMNMVVSADGRPTSSAEMTYPVITVNENGTRIVTMTTQRYLILLPVPIENDDPE